MIETLYYIFELYRDSNAMAAMDKFYDYCCDETRVLDLMNAPPVTDREDVVFFEKLNFKLDKMCELAVSASSASEFVDEVYMHAMGNAPADFMSRSQIVCRTFDDAYSCITYRATRLFEKMFVKWQQIYKDEQETK